MFGLQHWSGGASPSVLHKPIQESKLDPAGLGELDHPHRLFTDKPANQKDTSSLPRLNYLLATPQLLRGYFLGRRKKAPRADGGSVVPRCPGGSNGPEDQRRWRYRFPALDRGKVPKVIVGI